jgi:hypothetical protein
MRAGRRRITDDTDEVLNVAGAAVVPDMSRRMSRIPGDFTWFRAEENGTGSLTPLFLKNFERQFLLQFNYGGTETGNMPSKPSICVDFRQERLVRFPHKHVRIPRVDFGSSTIVKVLMVLGNINLQSSSW